MEISENDILGYKVWTAPFAQGQLMTDNLSTPAPTEQSDGCDSCVQCMPFDC